MRIRLLACLLVPLMACGDGGGDADGDPDAGGDMDSAGPGPGGGDTDGDGLSDVDEDSYGTDPNNADTDGDGVRDGDEVVIGTNPTVADEPCANVSAEASLVKRPVDIIFVIDNSGSMEGEILQVQQNISTNFADIIGASGLDYRIIMLSKHGGTADQSICISAPLSGTDCSPIPGAPANTSTFYQFSREIGSHDSLVRILADYPSYDQWLRADAVKVFVEITDDEATGETAASFDEKLLALSPEHFGTAAARNYVFHSIVGLKENDPVTQAWEPTDPEQTELCTTTGDNGSEAAGIEFQRLSMLTGGLRFPICYLESFDVVFQAIAQGVIDQVTVSCSFATPAGNGMPLDLSRAALVYTPGDGSPVRSFDRVDDLAQCSADSFYFADDAFTLCPDTCTVVQADETAQLDVLIGCETSID